MSDPGSDPNPEPVELKIKGPGISFERNISFEMAAGLIGWVVSGRPTSAPPEHVTGRAVGQGATDALSVGEMIVSHRASTNADRVLVIASYLASRGSEITRDEVKKAFAVAGEAMPKNFPRDFKIALDNKWLSTEDGKRFYVTATGKKRLSERQR